MATAGSGRNYTSIVRVFVGTNKKELPFLVYPSVLTKSSRVLQQAVRPVLGEQDLYFPVLNSSHFEIYVRWLHGGRMKMECVHQDPEAGCRMEQLMAIGAYNVGVHLQDSKFQNAAIKAMVEILTRIRTTMFPTLLPSPYCIDHMYKGTYGNTNMRKMLIQFIVVHGSDTTMDKYRNLPPVFYHEVNVALLGLRKFSSYKRPEEHVADYMVKED